MVKVNYIHPDGSETVEGREGDSVMATALAEGVDGIVAECGGSMMCATCHCHVDPDWVDHTGDRKDGEEDMLESAASPIDEYSRLSCQITLTPELDGLRVRLPREQI